MKCFFDLHVHSTNSPDSNISIAEIFTRAKSEGLSGIAITDHDYQTIARSPYDDVVFIPGIEIRIKELNGDLLAIGCLVEPPTHKPLGETIDEIHALGGVAIAPHPFDSRMFNTALGDNIFDVMGKLDGIEVTSPKKSADNAKARKVADDYGLAKIGGSDSHKALTIGRGVTVCEDVHSLDGLLDAIRARRTDGIVRR